MFCGAWNFMRLLVIEVDKKTAGALASGLERAGFATATAHTCHWQKLHSV
jgi:DNA-binding response OmpR family regulator